jgi:hypothetical protein
MDAGDAVSRRWLAAAILLGLAAWTIAVQPATAAVAITYSITAGTAGSNGWYVSDVTVSIQTPGATQSTCLSVVTFHSSADSYQCSASDGNATPTLQLQFKIDKDRPVVTGSSADRAANANGWYNGPVNVTFAGTDATSGIASCTQTTYNGPDSGSATVGGTCTDNAGNVSASSTFGLKYDSTPPSVSASPARPPDANGWYNHAVGVSFTGSDSTSGIDSCTASSYGGPDSAGATLTGTCTDKAGNSANGSFSLQYDSTPPAVKAALARPPDAGGWYNHPVALTATGTDAGSAIASCSGGTYSGPDTDAASLTATCTDAAGNKGSTTVPLKYDDTPPKLTAVSVTTGNGTATLHWKASPDNASVIVERTPGPHGKKAARVYKGDAHSFTDPKLRNGDRYRYVLSATDQAGNVARASATAEPRALSSPPQGATVRHPPLLRWSKVAGASYYNVQVFAGGHKILSMWPVGTTVKLPRSWTYEGHHHALGKGAYRWYVWPGFGPRKSSTYGKLLGGSVFKFG